MLDVEFEEIKSNSPLKNKPISPNYRFSSNLQYQTISIHKKTKKKTKTQEKLNLAWHVKREVYIEISYPHCV